MDISQFITEDLFLLIICLWFIGIGLKRTKAIPDEAIIFILTGLGIAGAVFIKGPTPKNALLGIICAAIAVFGQNVIKQGMILSGILTDPKKIVSGVLETKPLEPLISLDEKKDKQDKTNHDSSDSNTNLKE